MSIMETLNFPYYLYPGAPFCGYYNTTEYNAELKRLYNTIQDLSTKTSPRTILHITAGAPMEEQYPGNIDKMGLHWQQLYPEHLANAYNQGYTIIHLIISPNESFSDRHYVDPCFITKTNMLKVKNRHYTTADSRYTTLIFYTLMPHTDYRNESIINKIKKYDNFNHLIQTDYDRKFTNNFYSVLNNLFDKMSLVTFFSFAVFNVNTNRWNLIKYVMFPEIIDLFQNSNRILAEWIYIESCYSLRKYGQDNIAISYIHEPLDSAYAITITDKLELKQISKTQDIKCKTAVDFKLLFDSLNKLRNKNYTTHEYNTPSQNLIRKYANDLEKTAYPELVAFSQIFNVTIGIENTYITARIIDEKLEIIINNKPNDDTIYASLIDKKPS